MIFSVFRVPSVPVRACTRLRLVLSAMFAAGGGSKIFRARALRARARAETLHLLYVRRLCDLQETRDQIYGVSAANADLRFVRRAPRLPNEHYFTTLQVLPEPLLCWLPKPLGPRYQKPPKPRKTAIFVHLQCPPAVRPGSGAPQLARTARALKRAAGASGGGPAPKSHGGITKKRGAASAEKRKHPQKFPRTSKKHENYAKTRKLRSPLPAPTPITAGGN